MKISSTYLTKTQDCVITYMAWGLSRALAGACGREGAQSLTLSRVRGKYASGYGCWQMHWGNQQLDGSPQLSFPGTGLIKFTFVRIGYSSILRQIEKLNSISPLSLNDSIPSYGLPHLDYFSLPKQTRLQSILTLEIFFFFLIFVFEPH